MIIYQGTKYLNGDVYDRGYFLCKEDAMTYLKNGYYDEISPVSVVENKDFDKYKQLEELHEEYKTKDYINDYKRTDSERLDAMDESIGKLRNDYGEFIKSITGILREESRKKVCPKCGRYEYQHLDKYNSV
jgi:hypothetical protein